MKPFIQDGHTLALRAVRTLIEAEAQLVVEAIATVDWASATFVGKRHRCELRIEGREASVRASIDRCARELPEVDVGASGWFLADCALERCTLTLSEGTGVAELVIEALTIEE